MRGSSVEPCGGEPADRGDGVFDWVIDVPLLTSRFMVWDFTKVAFFAVLVMYVLVAACGLVFERELIVLPLFVFAATFGTLIALFVVTSLLLGNKQRARFIVSPKGAEYQAHKRERTINRLTFLAGLLARNATAAGAGALAASREQLLVPWDEVDKVVAHERAHVIELRNSWRVVQRLHCPPQDYDAIVSAVTSYHAAALARRPAAG